MNLRTSLFGHVINDVGSVGDLVVGVRSALDEANLAGRQTTTVECGTIDVPSTASLVLLGALASAEVWWNVHCMHTTEPDNDEFLYAARHDIQDVIAQAHHQALDGQPGIRACCTRWFV